MIYNLTPRPNQIAACKHLFHHKGAMLDMWMGAGKTKVVIDFLNNMPAIRNTLIICPKPVIEVWQQQLTEHGCDDKLTPVLLLTGSDPKNTKMAVQHAKYCSHRRPMYIINYESAWRPHFKKWALKQAWDMVVADEVHRIKSPSGKAAWFMATVSKRADRRVGLTGTPFPHSPLDIYAQFRFLDQSVYGKSYEFFKMQFTVLEKKEVFDRKTKKKRGYKEVIGYKNEPMFREKYHSITFQVSKEEVEKNLPAVTHTKRFFDLSDKAQKIYQDLQTNFVAAFAEGTLTAATALVRLLRFQQLSGGWLVPDDEDAPTLVDEGKIKALKDFLQDIPKEEPVVVICNFTQERMAIKELFLKEGRSVGMLAGGVNELQMWQDEVFNSLVVQIQAGREGVSFTRARFCVYYSVGTNRGAYEQSVKRIHRKGQTRPVEYLHLIARGTYDEDIYDAIQNGRDIIKSVMGR